jgi:hypothetical protein
VPVDLDEMTYGQQVVSAAKKTTCEWIPVTERLPEEQVDVLMTNGKYIFLGWDIGNELYSEDEPGDTVTHWMPLPDLPNA